MYLGEIISRIRTGRIHPDVKPEWVVVAKSKEIKVERGLVSVDQDQILQPVELLS